MSSAADRHVGQRLILALGFVGLMALPLLAAARDPAPSVPVEVTACGDDIPPSVREHLAVEVEVLWRESSSPPEMATLRVAIRCEGDLARIDVGATSETSRSTVDLTGLVREARSRLLAIKATELIHLIAEKTWARATGAKGDAGAEATGPSEDAAPALDLPPGADQSPESKSPGSKRASVSAGALALFAGRPLAYVVGPSLSTTVSLLPRISFGAEADGHFGSLHQPDRVLGMRGGAASATLLFVGNGGGASWAIGVGGRLGWLRLSGEAGPNANVIGKTSSGLWAGPMLVAHLSYPLASTRWFVEVGAEGGLVTLPLEALIDKSQRFYTLDGPWLGLRASLGLDLSRR